MAKFVWQDGTLVSKAKVEINGTIYEVDPEEYSGSTPLSASNLNAMVDNIYDDMKDTYSTTETIIGTYDGKTLYRKLYKGTLVSQSGQITTELDTGIDDLVNFGGYIMQGGNKFGLPSTNPSGSSGSNVQQQHFSRMIVLSDGTLRMDCSYNFSGNTYKVWAEYTKN